MIKPENKILYKNRLLLEKWPIPKEHLFLEIIQDLEVRIDKKRYPNSIFFFSMNRELIFEFYKPGNHVVISIYCSIERMWSVFEKQYGLKYNEIQLFINEMLEKHFKINYLTPGRQARIVKSMLEKHFKINYLTPHFETRTYSQHIEEHFKVKDLTPFSAKGMSKSTIEEYFNKLTK